tara:strand:+ start:66 stop:974 length:909 start_codon:yes stop_codon:yes gene_type:complete
MIRNIINKLFISIASLLPISFIRLIAGKYVAGENYIEAIDTIKQLNKDGYSVTIDILGEHSTSIKEAGKITIEYNNLYKEINKQQLDCNISVKPTHLGLDLGFDIAKNNFTSITKSAKKYNNFLRIDMESSTITDKTIDIYNICKSNYKNVGMVLQAYLHRSYDDLKYLSSDKSFNFRLCKGIYNESKYIAFKQNNEINDNFIKLLKYAFKNNIYVGIATHDSKLIDKIYNLIKKYKVSRNRFEFQVLYGVPVSNYLKKHILNGYKVRVYVPFGPDWYDYSIRRLKENPNIAGYIISNIFKN